MIRTIVGWDSAKKGSPKICCDAFHSQLLELIRGFLAIFLFLVRPDVLHASYRKWADYIRVWYNPPPRWPRTTGRLIVDCEREGPAKHNTEHCDLTWELDNGCGARGLWIHSVMAMSGLCAGGNSFLPFYFYLLEKMLSSTKFNEPKNYAKKVTSEHSDWVSAWGLVLHRVPAVQSSTNPVLSVSGLMIAGSGQVTGNTNRGWKNCHSKDNPPHWQRKCRALRCCYCWRRTAPSDIVHWGGKNVNQQQHNSDTMVTERQWR